MLLPRIVHELRLSPVSGIPRFLVRFLRLAASRTFRRMSPPAPEDAADILLRFVSPVLDSIPATDPPELRLEIAHWTLQAATLGWNIVALETLGRRSDQPSRQEIEESLGACKDMAPAVEVFIRGKQEAFAEHLWLVKRLRPFLDDAGGFGVEVETYR